MDFPKGGSGAMVDALARGVTKCAQPDAGGAIPPSSFRATGPTVVPSLQPPSEGYIAIVHPRFPQVSFLLLYRSIPQRLPRYPGNTVSVSTPVEEVLVEDGRAVGVRLKNGKIVAFARMN